MAHPVAIARRAGRTVLVASALPMALFYAAMSTLGVSAAILATLAWYYAGVLVRIARRRPLVGATLVGAALMTTRAVVAFWTGSPFLFFLQPVAGTIVTAVALLVAGLAGRPLLERVAHDFVPIPPALAQRLRARGYFDRTSLVWSLAYAGNALGTVWLLTSSSLGAFLLLKTLLSPLLTTTTVGVSYLLFRRFLRHEGVQLRWGRTHAHVGVPVGAAA